MPSPALPHIIAALASQERYAARKKNPDRDQPSLFETSHKPYLNKLGPGRWVTIHGGEGGEGEGKGGHHVFIGDDGKMKTGKFAGKTMSEAFGDSGKSPPPKQKRATKRGEKHERGQPGLFETEAQEPLPGMGPGNFLSQEELREYGRQAMEKAKKASAGEPKKQAPEAKPEIKAESKQESEPPSKPGDQLGLFGGVANVPRNGPATLKPGGETAGKQSALFDTKGDKDQMMMFDDGVTPSELVLKPAESGKPTPSQEAAQAYESAIESGDTPRHAAEEATKKLDADYEFARSSKVSNAGEDLKGSARHKVNEWRGLSQAEKDGTAEELMTRANLLKIEPHNLMATIEDHNALSHLAAHLAISAFPESPGKYPQNYDKYRGHDGSPLPPPTSPEKLREQYHSAYMAIKEKAEHLAKSEVDPRKVLREIGAEVGRQINIARGLPPDARGTATFLAKDPYNPVANALVSLNKRAYGPGNKKTDLMNRILEFGKLSKEKMGDNIGREHLAIIREAAMDLMEGKSMNKVFGKESKPKVGSKISPADMYVANATRKGGRDVSSVTKDPKKAVGHLVDSFGMRGVQWGNSVTDDERVHHAAKTVEAMTDLADVTGLHPIDISIDGKLGLAIGARGKGNASAHYEPGSKVINLTRKNGAGTIAHEWGHAFDHWLAEHGDGDYMSERHHLSGPSSESGIGAAFKEWKKTSAKYRDRLLGALRVAVREKLVSANKANEYWNSGREIFARSFERYVSHKLKSDDRENTYLSGFSDALGNANFAALWPNDEETREMASAFDSIFEEFRKSKHGSPEKVKFSQREAEEAFRHLLVDRYLMARAGHTHSKLEECSPLRYSASEAQREAGNYKMDHIRLHGLDISIETPKGQRRRPEWPPMPADYGYVRGTRGKDGDHVDVLIGPDRESELVVVVDQINQDGIFDEHKCLIGYRSESAAVEAYKKAYTPGWKVGPVTCMTIGQFKAWLQDGDQNKRIAGQVSKYSSREDDSPLMLLSDLVPIELVRYDWNAAAHPRHAAGSAGGIGGEFAPLNRSSAGQRIRSGSPAAAGQSRKPATGPRTSRKRELAEHPPTIRPGHALHLSALDGGMRAKLLDWAGRMHELTMPMYPIPTSPLSKEEQAEAGWGRVNKNAVRSLLDEMNQLDREARAKGLPLSDFVNANRLIPRQMAERLDGGSRFFDPEKIREKLHISNRNPNYVEPAKADSQEKPKKSDPPPTVASDPESKASKFDPSSALTPHENRSLDAVVREAVGENPSAEKHLKALALDAWQQLKQSADEHNYAFDQILGFADKTHTTRTVGQGENQRAVRVKKSQSRLLNQIRSGADPSTIKNFDELVDFARREFPGAISFVGGDSDTGSPEDGLLKLLREGRKEVPKPHSPEVIDLASEMAGPSFWNAISNPDYQDDQEVAAAVGSEYEEEIPFSVRRSVEAALIRYWGRPAEKKSA